MPEIGSSEGTGKTQALGFWQSETCDNSLAAFPDGTDFSWGVLSFELDGCDSNNYAEVKILKTDDDSVLGAFKYTSKGKKQIDLSQYDIGSTQDIKVMIELVSYV